MTARYSPFLFCAFVLVLFALPSVVASAGIRGPAASHLIFLYEPNRTVTATFEAHGAEHLTTYLEGDLRDSATLQDPNPGGGQRSFSITLTMPEVLAPGNHYLYVGVRESAPGGAMMGGVAGVRRKILVYVLEPNPYLTISDFTVASVPVNTSTTDAIVKVKSLTLLNLTDVFVTVTLSTMNGTLLTTRTSPPKTVPSNTEVPFTVTLPTATLPPGSYDATAVLRYGANTTNASTTFRVGTLDFILHKYPGELTVGTLNKFVFSVESLWSLRLDGVSGIVTIGPVSEQTPDVSFEPFGTTELKTYLDTETMALGAYDGTITIVHPDGRKVFPIRVSIVNAILPETVPEPETPGVFSRWFSNPLFLLYIGLFVIILFNILLLFVLFRRKGSGQTPPMLPENKNDV